MAFSVTYGGIPFTMDSGRVIRMSHSVPAIEDSKNLPPRKHQPQEDLIDELNRLLPFQYLNDFSSPGEPGRTLDGIAQRKQISSEPTPAVRIGDWYYPTGAGRWSVCRMLATSSIVKALLNLPTTVGNVLTMASEPFGSRPDNYSVSTRMFLLPPRPLGECGGKFDGLYLVTMVDERYYLQDTPVLLHPDNNSQWIDLLTFLADALQITINAPIIPDQYGQPEPDSQLWCNWEAGTTLLDAVASNLGGVVVRNLDGTYSILTPDQSIITAIANRNLTGGVRTAGGDMFNSSKLYPAGDLTNSKNFVVPQEITITFPWYCVGNDPVPHFINSRNTTPRPTSWFEDSYGDVYRVDIPITSGGINVSGLIGTSTSVIRNTAKALTLTEAGIDGNPINVSGLVSLANLIAVDRYNSIVLGSLDESYPGILLWSPEGLHDVLWTYSARVRKATTRVMRASWDVAVEDMQHGTPPCAEQYDTVTVNQRGAGGPLVAQTIRDNPAYSGSIVGSGLALLSDFAGNSLSLIVGDVGYYPTDSRWKGRIEDEIVLFEGTSGGIASGGISGVTSYIVDVVYRGIDGTVAADHTTGTNVIWHIPDTTYGVNLTTYRTGQYVFPSDTTSGGITGIDIIPQVQTVQILDRHGQEFQGGVYYSGIIKKYNPFILNASGIAPTQPPGASVWIIERNGLPAFDPRYNNYGTINFFEGEFRGYSPPVECSGKPTTAPLYAVNFPFAFFQTANFICPFNVIPPPINGTPFDINIWGLTYPATPYQTELQIFLKGNSDCPLIKSDRMTVVVNGTGFPIIDRIYGLIVDFNWSITTYLSPILPASTTTNPSFDLIITITLKIGTQIGVKTTTINPVSQLGLISLGDPTDLWGMSLTAGDISNAINNNTALLTLSVSAINFTQPMTPVYPLLQVTPVFNDLNFDYILADNSPVRLGVFANSIPVI